MRDLSTIYHEIMTDWRNPYFGAVPYLRAMATMGSIDEAYGFDSGRSVVLYFLANATSWRGAKAREIKAELKAMLAKKDAR